MPTIKLPEASKTIQSGTVRRWFVKAGQAVSKGDVLVELETEEGLLQVEAPLSGRLGQILVGEGKTAAVHAPLAVLEEEGAGISDTAKAPLGAPVGAQGRAGALENEGLGAANSEAGAGAGATMSSATTAGYNVIPVLMPKAGQSMEEGTIVQWRVAVGSQIKKGDVIFEIETDKATMEVEATDSGRLARIVVEEGGVLAVLQPVAYLAESDAEVEAFLAAQGQQTRRQGEEETRSNNNNNNNNNDSHGLTRINADNNNHNKDTARAEARTLNKGPAEAGTHTRSGGSSLSNDSMVTNNVTMAPGGRVKASPAARKVAGQRGVDLRNVGGGSGPGGRILSTDVPAGSGSKRRRMSQMRKAIARNLLASKQSIPHFYVRLTIDAGPMVAFYREQKAKYACSINDVIVMACARVIGEFPAFRSRIEGEEIVEASGANIGMAVGMDDGLVVPVLVGAERMSLEKIGSETKRLAAAAKGGKIEGMGQGCFTITNLGMFGTEEFAAIINPPEAGILAVGAAREAVVVRDGAMRAGKVMTMTLSADHRVVDGMLAAKFLARLKELLESPGSMV